MPQAKIELRLGNFQFNGEGEAAWLEKQLDKLLEHVKNVDPETSDVTDGDQKESNNKGLSETLSAFIKSSDATTNQVKKFLATACWLTKKGNERLATADVTKALSDNRQGKLTNPADCLNQNVSKGFCEKTGKQFYVTEPGATSLGKTLE